MDHPRACGKHSINDSRSDVGTGITPAPAGNTESYGNDSTWSQDHPRACGKHDGLAAEEILQSGSPPRLRETLRSENPKHTELRITPAPAGNTDKPHETWQHVEDHPRACGKHGIATVETPEFTGSPPRLRETLSSVFDDFENIGITPAPAGNTTPHSDQAHGDVDHPRACGKHKPFSAMALSAAGSPPRLRETQTSGVKHLDTDRITPAPAGNTENEIFALRMAKDHPRACGKHFQS